MPLRAVNACPRPGCPRYTPCPEHGQSWSAGRPGRIMPPGWAATRLRILVRDRYRCRTCGGHATEVDHRVRGIEDEWNLNAICEPCHKGKTQAEAQAARRLARAIFGG